MKYLILVLSSFLFSQQFELVQKITPPDRNSGDGFGYFIDVNEGKLLVSSPIANHNLGNGFVFSLDSNESSWINESYDLYNDQKDIFFCEKIALKDDFVFCTAPASNRTVGGILYEDVGSVHVFKGQELLTVIENEGFDEESYFGNSILVHNDNFLISNSGFDLGNPQSNAGSLYIYRVTNEGFIPDTNIYSQKVSRSSGFGSDICAWNNDIFIGLRSDKYDRDGTEHQENRGSVLWYRQNIVNGEWLEMPKILSEFQVGGNFGSQVEANDNYLVVSAPSQKEFYNNMTYEQGAVHVFKYDEVENDYYQTQMIRLSGVSNNDFFGERISLYEDDLIVTKRYYEYDPGENSPWVDYTNFYHFVLNDDNQQFELNDIFSAGDQQRLEVQQYGLKIYKDWVFLGSPNHRFDENGENPIDSAGAVYVFRKTPTNVVGSISNDNLRIVQNSNKVKLDFDFLPYDHIEIYSILGQKMYDYKMQDHSKYHELFLNSKGTFVVAIHRKGEVFSGKFIKNN